MSAGGRSRAAAIALLAGCVMAVGAAAVVPAALNWSKNGTIIRDARIKTLRAQERRDSRETLSGTQASWNAFVADPASGFSMASSNEGAINDAVARVKSAFGAFDGSATTVTGEIADSSRNGVYRIALEIRGKVPRKNLSGLLGSLEGSVPYLIIDKFEAETAAGGQLEISIGGAVYRLAEDRS